MSNNTKIHIISVLIIALACVYYLFNSNHLSLTDELFFSLLVGAILVLVILLHLWIIVPLKKFLEQTQKITAGDINLQLSYTGNREIDQIQYAFNVMLNSIKRAKYFIEQIGAGNLSVDFQLSDHQAITNDLLAQSLLSMRNQLQTIDLQEKQRQWIAEGLSLFSSILRNIDRSQEAIAAEIISNLVRYTGGVQGALYVLLEDNLHQEPVLQMASFFGLSQDRLAKTQFQLGESLVGQAFLEKQIIYISNLPPEYILVTGLGESVPRYLLIAPLMTNNIAYGVVEITSLTDFPDYVKEFILRVGENIAAAIATITATQKNLRLLEEAQEMTEQLRAQEEEMRQNMEELMATQEEMARKQQQLEQSRTQLQQAKEELENREQELRKLTEKQQKTIEELEAQRRKMEANELVLKKAYEKIRQAQQESEKKQKELEETNKQLLVQKAKVEANEIILRKSYEKMRQQQQQTKNAEVELQLYKIINRAIVKLLEGFYYACDTSQDYKVIIVEGNIQTLTGYPSEQFLKHQITLGQLIHPSYKEYVDKVVQKAIHENKSYFLEYDIIRADGSTKRVVEKGYPIFNEYDEVSHLIGFIIAKETAERLELHLDAI
ncbi:MAG: PAS domain-containing protein [Cytophagales bacterium]|nr:PAS domain-containing protein [Bernardetiaceae bacterium]MDW8210822.1 PAS domain-containing protein [Cytophagales bacterium]